MRFVRLPLPSQNYRFPQLFQRDVDPRRVHQTNLQKVAMTDMISVKRDSLDKHDAHDVHMLGVGSAACTVVGSLPGWILAHGEAYGVVEAHGEALTQLYDSFGSERVGRVHREGHVEVGIA